MDRNPGRDRGHHRSHERDLLGEPICELGLASVDGQLRPAEERPGDRDLSLAALRVDDPNSALAASSLRRGGCTGRGCPVVGGDAAACLRAGGGAREPQRQGRVVRPGEAGHVTARRSGPTGEAGRPPLAERRLCRP